MAELSSLPSAALRHLAAQAGSGAPLRAASKATWGGLPPEPATMCSEGCPAWSSRRDFDVGLCFGWPFGAAPPEGARLKGPGCAEVAEPWWCLSSLLLLRGSDVENASRAVLRAVRKLLRLNAYPPTLNPAARNHLFALEGHHIDAFPLHPAPASEREARLLSAIAAIFIVQPQPMPSDPELLRRAAVFYPRAFLLQSTGPSSFGDAGTRLRDDAAFMRAVVAKSALWYRDASPRLRANRDFALLAARSGGYYPLCYGPPEIRADREVVLAAVQSRSGNSDVLSHAPEEFKADRDVVLAAVRRHGGALQHASEALRADRETVLAAVRSDGGALRHASAALQADREVLLAATRGGKNAAKMLGILPEILGRHRDTVLAAVRSEGNALENASKALRNDRDVVLTAVGEDGRALAYASKALRADRAVVLTAVSQDGLLLRYASDALRADRDVVLRAVARSGDALAYASDALRADRDVVLRAVAQRQFALRHAANSLRADPSVVLAALAAWGPRELANADKALLRRADFLRDAAAFLGPVRVARAPAPWRAAMSAAAAAEGEASASPSRPSTAAV